MEDDKVLNYRGLKKDIFECKKWVKNYVKDYVSDAIDDAISGFTTDLMVNVTYSQLVSLRDNAKLVPGMKYRMTDYVTIIYDKRDLLHSAEHPFDLILTADSKNTLNENVKCALNANDNYFWNYCEGYPYRVDEYYSNSDGQCFYLDGTMEYEGKIYDKWVYKCYATIYPNTYILTEQGSLDNLCGNNGTYDYLLFDIDGEPNAEYVKKHAITGIEETTDRTILLLSDTFEAREEGWDGESIRSGNKCNLNAWKAKYCLDNDTLRFKYADAKNGKGYIYWLKDEFGNEAWFDFKNILQKDDDYTFGSGYSDGDFSCIGDVCKVYNNKILPYYEDDSKSYYTYVLPLSINELHINNNCYNNIIKSSCQNCSISSNYDNEAHDADISINNNNELVIFKPGDYITGQQYDELEYNSKKQYLTLELSGVSNNSTCTLYFDYYEGSDYIDEGGEHINATIEYSYDRRTWDSIIFGSNQVVLLTKDNPRIHLRGTNFTSNRGRYGIDDDYSYYAYNNITGVGKFSNDKFIAYGNIMSLINPDIDVFPTLNTLPENCGFGGLFESHERNSYIDLSSDKELSLPYNLNNVGFCFSFMFAGSEYLTQTPNLQELYNLGGGCYYGMFYNCTKLTKVPKTLNDNIAIECFCHMFDGCTSLTTAPKLPATTLAEQCYYGMFQGCTSLTTVPSILPATTLTESCYNSMFRGCSSLTTAPELPATTLAGYCYQFMFENCTSLTTAPELPATTLTSNCYNSMFNGCTKLNYIKCLAINGINQNNSTKDWVNGVSSNGTFVKHPDANDWQYGNSGIPGTNESHWTVVDNQEE